MAAKDKKQTENTVFLWQGINKEGRKATGEMSAKNIPAVRSNLQKQGVIANKIKAKPKPLFSFSGGAAITSGDIAVFSRMLATMLSSGVPLVQGVQIIGEGHEKPKMRKMIFSIREDIESGATLAVALSKFPLHFDNLFISLIHAGEQSGSLEKLLAEIATYKEKTEALKSKIKKSLMYPAAIIGVSFIVTAILMVFVIPQFEELFAGLGAELPTLTKIIISTSRAFQDNWLLIVLLSIATPLLILEAKKRYRKVEQFIDQLLLKLPIIGSIIKKGAIARFCRTFATMFRSGVPLAESMTSVAGATGNFEFSNATLMMRDEVSAGIQLNTAMKNRAIFPNMVVQMVGIGEESGELDNMMDKVAEFHEREVDDAVNNMTALLEPLIMVILGGIIGTLVVAMYLPIFKLGTAI